jgi:magnesium-transporting ATPase (P-type)
VRFYLGAIFLALGAWLIYKALDHRKRVLAARERAEAQGKEPQVDPQLASMGIAMLPFYPLYGAFASLFLIAGYFLSDLSMYLSVFDLIGLIVFVVGHSLFMVMRTAYSSIGLDMKRA